MATGSDKGLIFQLGDLVFFLDLGSIVEVVERVSECLDPGRSDLGQGIVSALEFRQTWIPVIDPALRLNILALEKIPDRSAIIVQGSEGNWALLVDRVVELVTRAACTPCPIPDLLKVSSMGYYSELLLYGNKPVVVFEPELYYGADTRPI